MEATHVTCAYISCNSQDETSILTYQKETTIHLVVWTHSYAGFLKWGFQYWVMVVHDLDNFEVPPPPFFRNFGNIHIMSQIMEENQLVLTSYDEDCLGPTALSKTLAAAASCDAVWPKRIPSASPRSPRCRQTGPSWPPVLVDETSWRYGISWGKNGNGHSQ